MGSARTYAVPWTRGGAQGVVLEPHKNGSPGRIRTSDPAVNSRLLYLLSYRGAERAYEAQLGAS